MKKQNKFLSVILPIKLFDKLEKAAKNEDRSKSKFVELLIRDKLEEKQPDAAVQQ